MKRSKFAPLSDDCLLQLVVVYRRRW